MGWTTNSGNCRSRYFRKRSGDAMVAADPGHPTERVLRVFCGYCRPGQPGDSCQTIFPHLPLAGDGCSDGRKRESGWKPGDGFWVPWIAKDCCAGMRDFWMAALRPLKKGLLPSAKPSVARAQSGWYWSMVKAFRREFGWMDGNCGATNVAGLWNEPTPGWDSFADCWFAMSICFPPVVLSSASLACGSP